MFAMSGEIYWTDVVFGAIKKKKKRRNAPGLHIWLMLVSGKKWMDPNGSNATVMSIITFMAPCVLLLHSLHGPFFLFEYRTIRKGCWHYGFVVLKYRVAMVRSGGKWELGKCFHQINNTEISSHLHRVFMNGLRRWPWTGKGARSRYSA